MTQTASTSIVASLRLLKGALTSISRPYRISLTSYKRLLRSMFNEALACMSAVNMELLAEGDHLSSEPSSLCLSDTTPISSSLQRPELTVTPVCCQPASASQEPGENARQCGFVGHVLLPFLLRLLFWVCHERK